MAQVTIEQAFQIGCEHCRAGRLAEAEQICRQVLALQPNHAGTLRLLGKVAQQSNRNDEASEMFGRAIAANPSDVESYNEFAVVLSAQGRLAEAIAALSNAVRLRPDSAELQFNLGTVLANHGRGEEAIATFRQALRLKPNYPSALNNLGNSLRDSGRIDEAIAAYTEAIRIDPAFRDASSNLAFAQAQRTRDQQARIERGLLQVRQSVAALEAESILRRQEREPRMPLEFTSQFGEDLLAWSLFGRQTTGFFVEAGAFDGFRYSVTYPLEAIGWNGLLVEAIPDRYAQCVARRPYSRVVHAALGSQPGGGTTEFCVVEDRLGGMFSYSKPTPSHLKGLANTPRSSVSVPIATLNELLKDHTGPLDLVVLDLEGAEMDALAGFDIARFLPRILVIEDNSNGQDPALRTFMQRFPYDSAVRLGVNDVYIRRDETAVIERLQLHCV